MVDVPKPPPILDEPKKSSNGLSPLWWLLGAMVGMVVLHYWLELKLPFPKCRWKEWTGIPCPGCGTSRALAACGNLQFKQALGFNPLVIAGLAGLGLWSIVWGLERLFRKQWTDDLLLRVKPLWWKTALFMLIALNWIYLCLYLP